MKPAHVHAAKSKTVKGQEISETFMTTYVQIRPPGYGHSIVVRTEESRQRASKRAVLKTPNFIVKHTAQDIADEKHLSRSKPYPKKGRNEAARRLRRMQAA
jgi:hypothetical protein